MRAGSRLWLLCAIVVGWGSGARAQAPWLPRAQLDNDAYNFWLHPAQRPDEEYTNGVKLSLVSQSAPWWGSHFAPRRRGCAGHDDDTAPCLATVVTLGQDLYTPRLDRTPYQVPNWEDERPYFAWLYLSEESRIVRPRSLHSLTLSVGVIGPPAGGQLAQRTAHAINRHFTRDATGWETQVAFEPGLVATYRHTMLAARLGDGAGAGVDLAPYIGASLGNILSDGEAGAVARFGWNLGHPWDPRAAGGRSPIEYWVSVGGRAEYVARNASLDGSTIRPRRHVDRTPGVAEYEVGFGLRLLRLSLGYRAVTRGREYATGPAHHAFSSMVAGLDFAR